MHYELTIVEKPGYLHAIVTGRNSPENVAGYLQAAMQECLSRGCRRLLIEENLSGRRLETWDVFEIASRGSGRFASQLDAVAYVDLNAHGELMKFAETVAVNRGLPLSVFATVEEAERWLAPLAAP